MVETNQLKTEHLGITALNFAAKHNSSSRSVMFSSHFSQRLVIEHPTERIVQTGVEREFSKYTLNVKMPENGKIIKIIERYPRGIGKDSLTFNPETIVIYEIEETKEIDYFSIPYYCSLHQFFGFKYEHNNAISQITPGAYIAKDTVFADSNSVGDNGAFKYGINLNTAFMSIPAVAEDGVLICEDVLDDMSFRLYERRTVEFGSDSFPLNIHGTLDNYKPFPDIGDYIKDTREDGVLMMFRKYNPNLVAVDMSIYDTMEPDFTFDRAVHARGGEGRVVDIKVIANNSRIKQLPEEMAEHTQKYAKAYVKFHEELVATERQLRLERKQKYGVNTLALTPRLHNLLVESLAIINYNEERLKDVLNLRYKKAPIDEYYIEFVIEYLIRPNIGFKITDCNGGKGVICQIESAKNMPVDANGVRADLVLDPTSTISRMNIGRLYEHYLASISRHIQQDLSKYLGLAKGQATVDRLLNIEPSIVDQAYQQLLDMYQIVSELQYVYYRDIVVGEARLETLCTAINDEVYIYCPIENQKDSVAMVKELDARFKPTYGPVSYIGNSGIPCTTISNIRIAPMYIMLLEKIADDWMSVSTGKLQHFGILSPTIRSEKYTLPYRNTPVRGFGEPEVRIYLAYTGALAVAEMLDRSNNPTTQRNMANAILNAKNPTNIDMSVDRNYIRLGGSKPLNLVKHVLMASGIKPVYEREVIERRRQD